MCSSLEGYFTELKIKQGEYSTTSLLFNVATRGISGFDVTSKDNMLMRDIVNAYQTEYIKELADKGPCVIVGRSADYILENRENCLNVFIHGNLVDRVKRVVDEHGIDPAEAEKHVLTRDKKRSKYYRHITDQVWGLAENYDLCLNSSKLGIDGCIDLIMDCCK